MPEMIHSILVPVDGSEQSDRAVDMAVSLADKYGGEVTVLCVYRHHSPLEASISMVRPSEPEHPDKALAGYAQEIATAAKQRALDAGAKEVSAYVKRGPLARTIVAFAKQHGADTIVMGARGTGDVEGFLLGSVSHKVSGLSPVTCILVK
ncbi:MAG: universal stress protein [Kiloniellaceae bacterium]